MIPWGRWLRGAGLVAVIAGAGCATFPPPRETGRPVSQEERDAVLARLQVREGQIRSLRGIAAVDVTWHEETRRFREALALRSDGRFRVETLGALGLPVLIAVSNGHHVVIRGAPNQVGIPGDGCDLFERLFGLDLPPAVLVRILAGLPPQSVVPSAFMAFLPERHAYLIEGEYPGWMQRLYIDSSGALHGGEIWRGRDGLRFTFGAVREVESIAFPMAVTLTQVRRPISVTVTYQAITINPILADRLFSLPPSGPATRGGC